MGDRRSTRPPEPSDPECEQLSERLQDPDRFASFFAKEFRKLQNYLRRFVSADEAEEIAQEAFARVYAVQGEIRSPTGLLYQTARNLLTNRYRRQKLLVMDEVGGDLESIADPHPSPEDEVYWRQKLDRAAVMIEHMPRRCREVFLLQVVDGLTYVEIAAKTGLSPIGVKKKLLQAFAICTAHAQAEDEHTGRKRNMLPGRGRTKKK